MEMTLSRPLPILSKPKTCRFGGWTLALVFLLSPIYILPSGSVQLVDLLIVIGIFACFFKKNFHTWLVQTNQYTPFVIWCVMVNLCYFACDPSDTILLRNSALMIYSLLIVVAFTIIFDDLIAARGQNYLLIGLFLCLIPPFLITGNHDAGAITRLALSFNNPNQLGFYSLLLMSFIVLSDNLYETNNDTPITWLKKLITVIVILISHVFVLLAISKSSIAAMLIVDFYYLRRISLKIFIYTILIILVGSIIILLVNPDFIDKFQTYWAAKGTLDNVQSRFDTQYSKLDFDYDFQVILGTGNGSNEKYADDREVHNLIASVFHCYGAIGVFFLAVWLIRLFFLARKLKGGLLVFFAMLFYNMFHNGIRTRLMYLLFSLIIALAFAVKQKDMISKPGSNTRASKSRWFRLDSLPGFWTG